MEPDGLSWDERTQLRRPILVAGFRGWNDAGDAASDAAAWLATRLEVRRLAHIDPETYFDFQSTRPVVTLEQGVVRGVEWPANEFLAGKSPGGQRDLVVLRGVEPNLQWRSFCAVVLHVARETGCELVVTLGALLADVPHTRAVNITGTATDPELVRRLGLERSRYEGPTGIVGVLHDTCRAAGLASASLWAPVPHYVSAPPNPVATRELVARLAELIGFEPDLSELDRAASAWHARVNTVVDSDDDIRAYVHQLETRVDAETQGELDDLPSGDDLAAELERYLREQRGDSS